jgi:hypothetical protein
MKKLWTNDAIGADDASVTQMPLSLQIVIGTKDHINTATKTCQPEMSGVNEIEALQKPIGNLLDIGFDHILTTNYSYELERVADPRVDRSGKYCKNMIRNIDPLKPAEPKYMLHTYNSVQFNGKENRIWHIHGEARKPHSIILGHYYYGTLLGRYQQELENRGNQQYYREAAGQPPIISSWLDAFIMGDVYALGFGFDFAEMDLWWLLNRKKRENAAHGNLYFYAPDQSDDAGKYSLLQAYGAKIERCGCGGKPIDYREFYDEAIVKIKDKVCANRRSM